MGFSGAAVTTAFVAPFLGRILDRYSPKKVILLGVVIVSVSYLLLATADTLVQFYLAVSLGMGLGMACMGGLAWHRSIISWFDHWRGRAISFAVMGASLSGVMMPPIVTVIVDSYGWRVGFTAFAVTTAAVLLPLVYWWMKDHPREIGEVRDGHRYVAANQDDIVDIESDSRAWTIREMLRTPAFWSIGVMFGSMTCVYNAVMLHLFGHLLDIGIELNQAALVLSATALFAFLGKPVVGWLSDFAGAKLSIWLALTCQGVALLIFTVADGLGSSIAAACLYGFGYSGMSPLRTFSLSTALGSNTYATAAGVIKWVELPFVLSASPLAGYIYDTTGSYQTAFLILAGLMFVACLGPFFIKAGGAVERRRLKAAQAGS
jgi:MFS family permease